MNPYLLRLRQQYDGLRSGIEGLQTRAATENRDLTDDELASVTAQGEQARALATQIESLTEIEVRHNAVAGLAAQVQTDTRDNDAGQENRSGERLTGNAQTRDRDPGHYRKGGGHSFYGDLFRSRSLQDGEATRRLVEHNRAANLLDEGPGVVPPVWMTQEFAALASQQRRVASAVRTIPISNAAPISMPRQTAQSGTVAELTTDETATDFTDGWDSAVTTVSPKATSGGQKVTRTLLDASNPAVDELIWTDLVSEYNSAVEAKVVAAMVTAAGAATKTYATEAAYTTGLDPAEATYVGDYILDTAIAVRNGRKLPADVLICSVTRYGSLLKIKDSTGRPLIPGDSGGPMNVIGRGEVAVDGRVHGLGVLASDGVTQYPESILVARANDTILFESPVLRFRYDEPDGPEIIRLGIWAYTAVHVKYSASVERIVITAAA